jgi:GrpB-like predicted nucleotidyltransferase (UPF0157 family)/aminoglycoside phosphotransferase (APT) family kinase protein
MFKADWEKTSITHPLPKNTVEKMSRLAYPDKKLLSHELISGGCANLNIKLIFKNENLPLILRIYLQDKDSAYREKKISLLLKKSVPVPFTYYIGELDNYIFAITEFMPGITLRDLLLSTLPYDMSEIMQDVGTTLSKITQHPFSKSGFFDKNLNINHELSPDFALTYSKECLENPNVISTLKSETILSIHACLEQYGHLFPDNQEKNLVHADFDPANILVDQINGIWTVSGVLDWEFAFAGSALCDVANMLRYAHKMPPAFQDAFLKGLSNSGIRLPDNLPTRVNLLNLLSLLDILKRPDTKNHPNQCADIQELIMHILSELNIMTKSKPIEVVPYDPNWPKIFEIEAEAIKKVLGDNCITIHHVGSTSVPDLAAKPIIDMIPVVHDIMLVDAIAPKMEALGYEARGEQGMIFRRYFKKENVNIHIYEQNSGEIDRCVKFRDWMREHKEDRDAYAKLKQTLAEQYPNDISGYCFGKDAFVACIDKKTGFSGLRVVKALTPSEWKAVKTFRGSQNSDNPIFTDQNHIHFVLYQGSEITGYAHIQIWPNKKAAIRMIVIEETKRNHHFGTEFLGLSERWLESQGYLSIHINSTPTAITFFMKNRYTEMPFNDPVEFVENNDKVALGKILK